MGAFYLTRKETAGTDASTRADDRIRTWFEREGFRTPIIRDAGPWRLYLFPKIVSPTENIFVDTNDDFCAATGTLLYRNTTGRAALKAILADHRGAGIDWTEAFGQYAVILWAGGKLELIGDPMGTYPVWYDDASTAISSSFLAVANAAENLSVDPQCVYEYVFQGTTYGDRTLFREIRLHAASDALTLGETVSAVPVHKPIPNDVIDAPIEEHVERNLANLHRYYDAIAACFGDRIDTALSGGYDSRLTLALLQSHGIKPFIHVYGSETDADVQIAKQIAGGQGFALEHQDKGSFPPVEEDAFADAVYRNLFSFHGHPPDGLFDNGTDWPTRISRCSDGKVALNGGGGEIFRNFFYLPDRSFTAREILWSFYGGFDPAWCSNAFDEKVYLSNKARKIRQAVGAETDRLSRGQVEALYPFYRCRYWMGRNNSVNNKLGAALTPFIDANIVPAALALPLRYKNSGRLEARMIEAVSPALAAYPSDYGHSFVGAPPLKRRLKDLMVYMRPPRLRRLTFRLKHRKPPERPYWLSEAYLKQVIDTDTPYMRQFFNIPRVNSLEHLNRIYTLELLFQHTLPNLAGRDT